MQSRGRTNRFVLRFVCLSVLYCLEPRSPSKPAATASGGGGKKRARLSAWTHEVIMQLINGTLAHVQREGDMLPGSLRTRKNAPISSIWQLLAAEITQTYEKVEALEDDSARDGCGADGQKERSAHAEAHHHHHERTIRIRAVGVKLHAQCRQAEGVA
jgi:hypothetical protein